MGCRARLSSVVLSQRLEAYLTDTNNLGSKRNAAIQVLNIIVHRPNAPRRHEVSDGLGRMQLGS